jgi:hypothetical protein
MSSNSIRATYDNGPRSLRYNLASEAEKRRIDAEAYRDHQARELLLEAGCIKQPDGAWLPGS